jgi:LL-diaminopimelate aminotransferase
MRLQQMFGSNVVTAVQDPSYPVYVDTSVMLGQTGAQDPATRQYEKIIYMPCTPENQFFPNYADHPRADVVYLCSPKYVHLHVHVCVHMFVWSLSLSLSLVSVCVRG